MAIINTFKTACLQIFNIVTRFWVFLQNFALFIKRILSVHVYITNDWTNDDTSKKKVQKSTVKKNTTTNNKNYRTQLFITIQIENLSSSEMKLVPINMDDCPLQFDALKFFLGVRLHGGGSLYLTLIYSMLTPKFFNEIVKFTSQIALKQIFTTFLT